MGPFYHQAPERDATWPSAPSAAGPSAVPAAAAPAPPRASQARPPRSSSSALAFVLRSSAYEAHASSCPRRSRLLNPRGQPYTHPLLTHCAPCVESTAASLRLSARLGLASAVAHAGNDMYRRRPQIWRCSAAVLCSKTIPVGPFPHLLGSQSQLGRSGEELCGRCVPRGDAAPRRAPAQTRLQRGRRARHRGQQCAQRLRARLRPGEACAGHGSTDAGCKGGACDKHPGDQGAAGAARAPSQLAGRLRVAHFHAPVLRRASRRQARGWQPAQRRRARPRRAG
jgi:hypothetical protein